MSLSPRQFGAFLSTHAPSQAVAWARSAAAAGGLQRDQPQARLLSSKPYPKSVAKGGPPGMYGLMEKLAPGSTTLRQRTRGLN